jgi:hypothetical protein
VVVVTVRDQDGGAGRTQARELEAELRGVVARVDHDGLARVSRGRTT